MIGSHLSLILKLWSHIDPIRRKKIPLVVFLMIASSFAEIMSIGSVLPFIAVLIDPTYISNNNIGLFFIELLEIHSSEKLLFFYSLSFCLLALISGALRFLTMILNTRLSFQIGSDIGVKLYKNVLFQPYNFHLRKNSSELIGLVSIKSHDLIHYTILPILNILAAGVLLVIILGALIYINPYIALSLFFGFGLVYLSFSFLTKKQLQVNSKNISIESSKVIQSLQEGLGGIRDVILEQSQDFYADIYKRADAKLRNAQSGSQIIGLTPRFIIEPIGLVLIAYVAYLLAINSTSSHIALPVLATIAVGSQRLLPLYQQLFGSWSYLKNGQESLRDAVTYLDSYSIISTPYSDENLFFKEKIEFKDVSYTYESNKKQIFIDASFTIKKGARVGVVGPTGSGKSTLMDILMGLISPTSGEIMIDNTFLSSKNLRAWRKYIAHVPQNIYLSDATILENIAFGIPINLVNMERVELAAKQAQLYEFISDLPNKFNQHVGERGISLSGGQRQRIGIARALYKQSEVIVFDEATSALDYDTESRVMSAINKIPQEVTIFIVAHRLSTVKNCNYIINIQSNGSLIVENFS